MEDFVSVVFDLDRGLRRRGSLIALILFVIEIVVTGIIS